MAKLFTLRTTYDLVDCCFLFMSRPLADGHWYTGVGRLVDGTAYHLYDVMFTDGSITARVIHVGRLHGSSRMTGSLNCRSRIRVQERSFRFRCVSCPRWISAFCQYTTNRCFIHIGCCPACRRNHPQLRSFSGSGRHFRLQGQLGAWISGCSLTNCRMIWSRHARICGSAFRD